MEEGELHHFSCGVKYLDTLGNSNAEELAYLYTPTRTGAEAGL